MIEFFFIKKENNIIYSRAHKSIKINEAMVIEDKLKKGKTIDSKETKTLNFESFDFILIGESLDLIDNFHFFYDLACFIDSAISNTENFLSRSAIYYVDGKIDFYMNTSINPDYKIAAYQYDETLGIFPLSEPMPKYAEQFMICYFYTNYKKLRNVDSIFYHTLPDNSHIIGISKYQKDAEHYTILIIRFPTSRFEDILAYRHHFINLGFEYIDKHYEEFVDLTVSADHKQNLLDKFNELLSSRIYKYLPRGDLIGLETLLNAFKEDFGHIITTAMIGKPIAIIADKESATYIIDLLIYITGLTDASITLDITVPRRFTKIPAEMKDLFKKLGYAIIDLYNVRLENYDTSKYFSSKNIESPMEYINELKEKVTRITSLVTSFLRHKANGARAEIILEYIDDDEAKILKKILNWLDPNILSDNIKRKTDKIIW